MISEKIDFSDYTKDELFDSLESVDDELYPETAVEIYSLLESISKSDPESVDCRYKDDDGVLEGVMEIIFFPVLSNQGPTKFEMREKLHRIRKMMARNEI